MIDSAFFAGLTLTNIIHKLFSYPNVEAYDKVVDTRHIKAG